jgi:LPS-assembly lipoprotein
MLSKQTITLALCIGLGSCGYQPLYGTSTSGATVSNALADVSVDEQTTRTGQLIRNELLSSLGKTTGRTRFRLGFTATSNDESTIKTFGSDVLRKSYQLNVKYSLSDIKTGKVIHRGSTFAHVSYDKTAAAFSDYQAKISAKERAAKQVGSDIHTRLAAYFAAR